MKKVWCLFSIANDYNQPANNLCAWWSDKPQFEVLATAVNIPFKGDDNILDVVNIHQGQERSIGGCSYRLEQIGEGALL